MPFEIDDHVIHWGNKGKIILGRQNPVACTVTVFLDLQYHWMRSESHWCIAMAIKLPRKVGTFCIIVVLIVALAAAGTIRSE